VFLGISILVQLFVDILEVILMAYIMVMVSLLAVPGSGIKETGSKELDMGRLVVVFLFFLS
jgi:hypothetical protein